MILNLKMMRPLLLVGLILSAFVAAAQQQVTGRVVSEEDGETLPGVTVLEKGTTNGTITDLDGKYTIQVADGATLVFSFVGFSTKEVAVAGRSIVDVTLSQDMKELSEVVVVGYGTVDKSDLTGSVVSVKPDEMTAGANLTVEQMLQGRAPGVSIQSKSGEPGGAISVKIRGAGSINAGNEPLYVIDGMPFNTGTQITSSGSGFVGNQNPRNPLNALNPNDIASIEILKDASATAIYGSRGSNGVVLITTKSGQAGKIKVNYGYSRSVQEIAKKYELLNAAQYQEVLNNILDEGGGPGNRVEDFQGDGMDWTELLYRDGSIDEHNLSFSGGNENTKYYVSLNAFSQEGVLISSGIDRYNLRLNIDSEQSEKFRLGLNLNTSYIHDDYLSNGTGVNENAGALYAAIYYDPTITRIIDPFTGRYVTSENLVIDNPLALANHEEAEQKTFRTYGSLFGEYFITPELSAKVKIAGDVSTSRRDVWVGPETLQGVGTGGIGSIFNATATYHLGEFTMNYNQRLGEHSISAVTGVTYEEFNRYNNNAEGSGFLYPDLKTNALGSGADSLEFVGSSRNQNKLNSWLGRVNYSFKNKYLVTASIRADGSSRFGPNNKVGIFPSFAVGWKLHEEAFMNFNPLSILKLRGSYGSIGNQAIPNNLYVSTFSPGPGAVLGGVINPTIQPTRAANPNLQWESATQMDIGVDFGFLDDRISGSIDYYIRDTKDLLLQVPQPTSLGFLSRWENLGKMRNQGWEFALSAYVVDQGDFQWEVTGNLSTLKNKVVDLGGVEPFLAGNLNFVNGVARVAEDTALFSYWGYVVEGVWQTEDDYTSTKMNVVPGDWKYKDINGDSLINSEDKTIVGKPFPDVTWGLTNTVKYKGLSLTIYVDASHGNSLLNQNLVNTYYPIAFRNNRLAEPYLNRWTSENPTNEYSSFVRPTGQGGGLQVNSKTVEDASYIRLQSIRLGYEVPVNELGINFIERLSVYVVGQNLKTWTDYSGVDPAVNSFGNNNIPMDFNAYPFSRTYTVGVNIGF